jgi:hypothetical protein
MAINLIIICLKVSSLNIYVKFSALEFVVIHIQRSSLSEL